MGEKTPHRPLLEENPNDNFVHPTAPPSYDEAMIGGNQSNQSLNPTNPYQGYTSQVMPNPAAAQPHPQSVPIYPSQPGNVQNPAVTQPVPYGMYPNQLVTVLNPPPPVTTVNIAMPVNPVGPKGMRMRCRHCGADIKTATVTSNKASAHLACLILCIFTCCLCSWIPYCMSSCKKIDHNCPNCKGYLGTYNP